MVQFDEVLLSDSPSVELLISIKLLVLNILLEETAVVETMVIFNSLGNEATSAPYVAVLLLKIEGIPLSKYLVVNHMIAPP
jgi:hypothetical protein